MLRRPALLGSLAVALIGGCAASRTDRYPSQAAANPFGDKPSVAITQAVDQHNQNADKVEHMQATAAVSTSSRVFGGAGSGILEFERPRNFRFQVEAGFSKKADIGSNDEEFWFWGADRKNPATIYKCHYDSLADSAEQPPFQPEWIIEALGLNEIPESEIGQIRITKNVKPGVDLWTHTRPFGRSTVQKITLVDQQTGRFLEHRFYPPGVKIPIAIVTPNDYRELRLASGDTVVLPQKLHLKIQAEDPKQGVELDLALSGTNLNKPITPEQRTARFEPKAPDISPNAQVYYLDESNAATARGERITKPQKPEPGPAAPERKLASRFRGAGSS